MSTLKEIAIQDAKLHIDNSKILYASVIQCESPEEIEHFIRSAWNTIHPCYPEGLALTPSLYNVDLIDFQKLYDYYCETIIQLAS